MFRIAAYLNFFLAIAHLLAMVSLEKVFQIYGINKEMDMLAQLHPSLPYIITIVVALVFFVFGLYALSADGRIRKLPLLKLAVFGIAAAFLLRSVLGIIEMVFTDTSVSLELTNTLGAFFIGFLYLWGGIKKWNNIKKQA